jgi:hypothetical protein
MRRMAVLQGALISLACCGRSQRYTLSPTRQDRTTTREHLHEGRPKQETIINTVKCGTNTSEIIC